MRISTNTIYQSGISKISDIQVEQSKLQQQIATGRRILTPSDDPVGSARALQLTQSQKIGTQYADNRGAAQTKLGLEDGTLQGVSDLLLSVKTALVAAGNGSYSDTERNFLASELEGSLDHLLGLANATDGAGHHIFSGSQTGTIPFTKTTTGATYQGDALQQKLQVGSSRQLEVNDAGNAIFQAGGQDIFKSLTDAITLLKTPVTNAATAAALTTGLNSAQSGLESTLDSVLTTRAMVGSRLKELEALDNFGSEANLQYAQSLSSLQDLDYAKALSDASQQQTILTAAQKSFVNITSLSLFDLIR
ncbi:MAG: flagellar hook-associated protein FlgL [Methylophilaceae bacterium]|nr:flagellar hook-associated protein FlgL [Methylophilaceae bacterium]